MISLIQKCILLDKPPGFTSNKVLNIVKKKLDIKKAGFSGTLDPFASGLLIIFLNKSTKACSFFLDSDKSYSGEIKLGKMSSTGDPTGEISVTSKKVSIEEDKIKAIQNKFFGESFQKPPKFSAIKINGQRAYELARKGVNVDIPERKIFVNNLDIIKTSESTLKINISCSKGTYIRSIAQDISKEFGYDGYLLSLRRESIGKISLKNALSFNDLETLSIEKIYSRLVSVDTLFLDTNKIALDKDECTKVCNGQEVFSSQFSPGQALIYSHNRDFIGIGEVSQEKVLFPKKIFV